MRKFLTAILALLAVASPARAQTIINPQPTAASGQIPAYLGFADNRGMIPDAAASSGSAVQFMVRSLRYARADMADPRPVFACGWYVGSNNVEIVQAGTYTYKASIQLPNGTIIPYKFGGNASGTCQGGENISPDAPSNVSIARGSTYVIYYWFDSPNGYVFTNQYAGLAGDAFNTGTTTADLTTTGMAGSSPGSVGIGPIGVIATITQRSFFIIGDSITGGQGTDERDVSGDFGVLARIVGPRRGYVNSGRPSVLANQFTSTNASRRIALGNAYASDIISGYGINDALNSIAATTIATTLRTIRGYFPTKRFYQATVTPTANGSGTACVALDGSDQVLNATASGIIDTLNGLIKLGAVSGNAINFTGYVDVRAAVELIPGSQKVKPGWYNTDCLHPKLGYRLAAPITPGAELLQW
ncbi:SGNH/GDSL hydrolase family protein [Sphingobium sp.]|uniref:SGNH/GDSL hydrolase family protein n=1 Tax=Sphingobium sp. TaxID=1912891 RepID=UPI003BB60F13